MKRGEIVNAAVLLAIVVATVAAWVFPLWSYDVLPVAAAVVAVVMAYYALVRSLSGSTKLGLASAAILITCGGVQIPLGEWLTTGATLLTNSCVWWVWLIPYGLLALTLVEADCGAVKRFSVKGMSTLQAMMLVGLVIFGVLTASLAAGGVSVSLVSLTLWPFVSYFVALYVKWLCGNSRWSLRAVCAIIVAISIALPAGNVWFACAGNQVYELAWWQMGLVIFSVALGASTIKPLISAPNSRCFVMTIGVLITIWWTVAQVYMPLIRFYASSAY